MKRSMRRPGTFARLTIVGIVVLVFCCYEAHRVKAHSEHPGRYGHYTAAQIIDRSEELCRAITMRTDKLWFAADRRQAYAPNGAFQRHWAVECKDAEGNVILHLLWDADTGDLCTLAQLLPPGTGNGLSNLSAKKAVSRAAEWMQALGIAAMAHPWRLANTPTQEQTNWKVQWQAPGRSAFIAVNIHTGDLTLAGSWQTGRQTRHEGVHLQARRSSGLSMLSRLPSRLPVPSILSKS